MAGIAFPWSDGEDDDDFECFPPLRSTQATKNKKRKVTKGSRGQKCLQFNPSADVSLEDSKFRQQPSKPIVLKLRAASQKRITDAFGREPDDSSFSTYQSPFSTVSDLGKDTEPCYALENSTNVKSPRTSVLTQEVWQTRDQENIPISCDKKRSRAFKDGVAIQEWGTLNKDSKTSPCRREKGVSHPVMESVVLGAVKKEVAVSCRLTRTAVAESTNVRIDESVSKESKWKPKVVSCRENVCHLKDEHAAKTSCSMQDDKKDPCTVEDATSPHEGGNVIGKVFKKSSPLTEEGERKEIKLPDVGEALNRLHNLASKGQIVHVEHIPPRPGVFSDINYKLPQKLEKALKGSGIGKLYTHQAAAINAIFGGSSIVAATPTASGKSLTYIIPVLEALMDIPKSRALFIFPLKALARDQLKALCEMASKVMKRYRFYSYDGDTPEKDKAKIRRHGQVILTNPDMLHYGVLPNHKIWEQFFSNLKFIVLDEAHTYRGVFGSHVGLILRRLMRISRHYGAEPMLICCSATIGNPKEHVKELTMLDTEVILGSGAPSGEKHIVCWHPPQENGKQRSAFMEAADIVVELMKANLQLLVFVEARTLTETVCNAIREKLATEMCFDLVENVDSYRAGYSPQQRQTLEKRLQSGDLRVLVTTRALELGIDVGELDATVHVGLPDTMCCLWQQAGRAGRRQGASLAVIVALERPVDIFYMRNPHKLFGRDIELAFCNASNPHLLRLHLPCAANELALEDEDCNIFGEGFVPCRDELLDSVLELELGPKGESLYGYKFFDNPALQFSIRGVSKECFRLVTESNALIEEMDSKMAFKRLFKGAIYTHQRSCYEIIELSISQMQAVGRLCNVNYITEAREKMNVTIIKEIQERKVKLARVHLGQLSVKEQVVEYCRKNLLTNTVLGVHGLDLPPMEYETIGMWWDIPLEALQQLSQNDVAYDALQALKRVALAVLPSMTMSDAMDMNGMTTLNHEQTLNPQIFVYDAHPGGIGLMDQAFKQLEEVWKRSLTILHLCDCKNGCPACIQTGVVDKESGKIGTKQACIILLKGLLGSWMSSDSCAEIEYGMENIIDLTTD